MVEVYRLVTFPARVYKNISVDVKILRKLQSVEYYQLFLVYT